jgi:predicted RNase H-like HicB family nuclease
MRRGFRLAVALREAEEGGYWVEVPSLPGCVSQGDTAREALANVKEAIELTLECLIEDGEPAPEGNQEGRTVTLKLAVPA